MCAAWEQSRKSAADSAADQPPRFSGTGRLGGRARAGLHRCRSRTNRAGSAAAIPAPWPSTAQHDMLRVAACERFGVARSAVEQEQPDDPKICVSDHARGGPDRSHKQEQPGDPKICVSDHARGRPDRSHKLGEERGRCGWCWSVGGRQPVAHRTTIGPVDDPGELRQHTRPSRTGVPRGDATRQLALAADLMDLLGERQGGGQLLGCVRSPALPVLSLIVVDRRSVRAVPADAVRRAGTDDSDLTGATHQDRAGSDLT
jgi:hypothetical protein